MHLNAVTTGTIHLGTSGWVYAHWRELLYPKGLPEPRWLERYAEVFSTVEINSTFYHLVAPETFTRWRTSTPRDFVFAVKGSRFVTHMKRLLEPKPGLARFFHPLRSLGKKAGPILWQLPPRFRVDHARLDRFLRALPKTRKHVVELRDREWYSTKTCSVLDAHGVAFCEHDLVDVAPPGHTGGFRYVRFHGKTGKYRGRYGRDGLRSYARDFDRWRARGCDAWVYFNNDTHGHALYDARDLGALLGIDVRLDLP